VSTHFTEGGRGAVDLARSVLKTTKQPAGFRMLYPLQASIEEKIELICTQVYGAEGVDYSPHARSQIEAYTRLGYDRLPICMAKTPLSLSHDPALKGVPKGFRVPIREVKAAVGAGYLYPLAGEIQTMPGLPTRPAFF
jgi:formyltetrahydrofolate synthetase